MCTQTHTNCAAKMLEQGWQVFLGHPDVAGVARLPVDGRVPQGAAAEKCGNITNDVTDDRSLNFLFSETPPSVWDSTQLAKKGSWPLMAD